MFNTETLNFEEKLIWDRLFFNNLHGGIDYAADFANKALLTRRFSHCTDFIERYKVTIESI